MGTGWRKAFCKSMPREKRDVITSNHENQSNLNPRYTRSEPTTPRMSCKTYQIENNAANIVTPSPRLQCKTKSPRTFLGSSTPSSPRSPFSMLKNTLRLSGNGCGVCMQSMKTGQRTAIYTAECSHAFHFPCITSHVRKQYALVCPVCSTAWKDFPFLALQKQNHQEKQVPNVDSPNVTQNKPKHTPVSSPRYYTKPYADDEPLVTPRAGAKFVPIPEVQETEEEVEEFKGFFTNPISSTDNHDAMNSSRNVEVSLLPEAAVVSVGRTHDTYAVVLKVKAPRAPPASKTPRRAPIDLVTVLDVSGSMIGAKIEMLKRAMRLVISSLGSADRLSIVTFSATPKRLLPLMRMNTQGQRIARQIIDRLNCSQGTSMGEALKQATKVLEDRRERNPVSSIILLSDGQGDTGTGTGPGSISKNEKNQQPSPVTPNASATRFSHVEIPIHTPAEDAFTKCVGELLSVVVQDLRIQISFGSGSDPAEIMAVYSCGANPGVFGPGCIRIGDLYAEEEREVLVEVRVPKSVSNHHYHHVFAIKSCYRDPASLEPIYGGERALLVPRPQVVRASLPKVERLRNSFISTRATAESRRLIEHDELASALPLLSSARDLLIQSRSETAGEYIRGLEAVIAEVLWRRQYQRRVAEERGGGFVDENGEPITPMSAKVKSSFSRANDLHGFENARF